MVSNEPHHFQRPIPLSLETPLLCEMKNTSLPYGDVPYLPNPFLKLLSLFASTVSCDSKFQKPTTLCLKKCFVWHVLSCCPIIFIKFSYYEIQWTSGSALTTIFITFHPSLLLSLLESQLFQFLLRR